MLFEDIAPPVTELAPRAQFEAVIMDPPVDAVNMEVRFTDRPVPPEAIEDAHAGDETHAAG